MSKIYTILVILLAVFTLAGCSAKDTAMQLLTEGETEVANLPVDGQFFTLERVDDINEMSEVIEVNYDGQVKLKSGDTTENMKKASEEEVKKMYELIKAGDYDGLKTELAIENSGEGDLNETLTLFTPEGQQEIKNITAEDLSEGEKPFLPDKWDVTFGKVRRFFGNLTGEPE